MLMCLLSRYMLPSPCLPVTACGELLFEYLLYTAVSLLFCVRPCGTDWTVYLDCSAFCQSGVTVCLSACGIALMAGKLELGMLCFIVIFFLFTHSCGKVAFFYSS